MSSQTFQQYIRILLYGIFSGVATMGFTVPDNNKAAIAGVAGFLANLVWTMYGTRLNGLLEMVREKTGVESIEIKVNPEIIPPTDVTANTSSGIVAKPVTPPTP